MIRIDKGQLGALSPLGQGGMAQVHRVGASIPQLPGNLAFKELLPKVVHPLRTQMLTTMRLAIDLRDAMSVNEQKELDDLTVWPLAMVHDKGTDVGLLMRCIPDAFFIDALEAGKPSRRVFEFQLLGADGDQAKKIGIQTSRAPADNDLVRLALMARLAYAIEIIHRPRGSQRLVYGDLSLRNAAVATNPPRILLMDCDGVADLADTTRVQPHSPFFKPPELNSKQKLQDQLTDVYKLGLCIIRGLARGRGSTQLANPASTLIPAGLLDQAGIDLLKRAINPDRTQRPTAEDIKDYLIGRVLDLADPPTLYSAQLSSDVVRRGSYVRVHWTHKGGKKVRIYNDVKTLDEKDIEAGAYPNGYRIRPTTDCEIFVAVSNDHGEDIGSAGLLVVYEIPSIQFSINPPSVVLPDMPTMDLPETHAKLPPYPMHPADVVAVPSIVWPKVPALKVENVVPPRLEVAPFTIGQLAPQGPILNDLRDAIGHAYHAADAGVDAAIGDALRRRARRLLEEAEQTASANPPTP